MKRLSYQQYLDLLEDERERQLREHRGSNTDIALSIVDQALVARLHDEALPLVLMNLDRHPGPFDSFVRELVIAEQVRRADKRAAQSEKLDRAAVRLARYSLGVAVSLGVAAAAFWIAANALEANPEAQPAARQTEGFAGGRSS